MRSACTVEAGGNETVSAVEAPSAVTCGNGARGAGRSARPAASGASAGGSARAIGPPSRPVRLDQRGPWLGYPHGPDGRGQLRPISSEGGARVDQRILGRPNHPTSSDGSWKSRAARGWRCRGAGRSAQTALRGAERMFTDQRPNPSGQAERVCRRGGGVVTREKIGVAAGVRHMRDNISVDSKANAGRSAWSHNRLRLHQRSQPHRRGEISAYAAP